MAQGKNRKYLTKRARKGHKGYPVATVAFYGPDNRQASKMVCSIIKFDGAEPNPMKKWSTEYDARKSERILGELIGFLEANDAKSIAMMDQIMGCPHEENIDYPEGESCSACPFWKNRDRFTHAVTH